MTIYIKQFLGSAKVIFVIPKEHFTEMEHSFLSFVSANIAMIWLKHYKKSLSF